MTRLPISLSRYSAPNYKRTFIFTECGRVVPGLGLILREEVTQDSLLRILFMREDFVFDTICESDYTVVESLGCLGPKVCVALADKMSALTVPCTRSTSISHIVE